MARRTELPEVPWHSLTIDEVFRRVESGRQGLPAAEAARRLATFGRNTMPREPPPTLWRLAIGQLANLRIVTPRLHQPLC